MYNTYCFQEVWETKASGATTTTTSSMKMEIVALTRALGCIAANQPKSRHLVFVTDPQSRPTIRKVKPNNMLRSEQIKAIHRIRLRSVVWIFCPGHAGVRGNEAADKLAGEATVGRH